RSYNLALSYFKQASSTHAASNTHRNDYIFYTAALTLDQGVANKARTGHTKGVTNGDTAAVHVQLGWVDFQLLLAINGLAGKGFVDFEQADIVDFQTRTIQQLGNGENRANAHFIRAAARHLE